MTISEFKAKQKLATLPLRYHVGEDGTKTQWLRYWDNEKRVAIVVHADVFNQIKDNPDLDVHPHTTQKEGSKGIFTSIVLVSGADEVL